MGAQSNQGKPAGQSQSNQKPAWARPMGQGGMGGTGGPSHPGPMLSTQTGSAPPTQMQTPMGPQGPQGKPAGQGQGNQTPAWAQQPGQGPMGQTGPQGFQGLAGLFSGMGLMQGRPQDINKMVSISSNPMAPNGPQVAQGGNPQVQRLFTPSAPDKGMSYQQMGGPMGNMGPNVNQFDPMNLGVKPVDSQGIADQMFNQKQQDWYAKNRDAYADQVKTLGHNTEAIMATDAGEKWKEIESNPGFAKAKDEFGRREGQARDQRNADLQAAMRAQGYQFGNEGPNAVQFSSPMTGPPPWATQQQPPQMKIPPRMQEMMDRVLQMQRDRRQQRRGNGGQ